MGVFRKIGAVISRPSEFFEDAISENIAPAFSYAALIYAIYFILLTPVLLVGAIFIETPAFLIDMGLSTAEIALLLVLILILGYLVKLIFTFILAALFHMWCLLWGAIGDYTDSYKAVVYAITPTALLGWTIVLLPITIIWSWVLLGIATAKMHNFSKTKTFWMIFVLFVILAAIGGTSAFFFPPSFTLA